MVYARAVGVAVLLSLNSAAWAAPAPAPIKPAEAQAALSAETREQAEKIIRRAEEFMRSRQDKATGGWSVPTPGPDGKAPPTFPGITALALTGLAMQPAAPENDAAITLGVKHLLNFQQDDGGIYDRMLPSYNTALSVSALSRVGTDEARAAVKRGVEFLRKLQWSEESDPAVGGEEAPKKIDRSHPFYGGVGYGRHGRPDNSNLNIFMQAMQDAGVSPDDPAVQRALVFLQRTQMDERVNDMPYAKGSRQGGFVYATVPNAESVDGMAGQSMAGMIEETLSDGTKASRLRAYGSMTYAGFKSYLYAQLPRDDVRVTAAWDWIRRNYTVDENPGMKDEGRYYYYVVFARALQASGADRVATLTGEGKPTGESRDWRADLIGVLGNLQKDDGSFTSVSERWMENNPELITAYALIALKHALR
jgi:squalene-hopene/tetraprenyl-beta-curcumene cyclase